MDTEGPALRELIASHGGAAPAERRVGRDGHLRLRFERREAATVLVEREFRTPLQVLEPMVLTDDGSIGIMLLNPTGGLLAGDRLESDLDLGEGSHVYFTTPSATRVYRSTGPTTVQHTRVRVAAGATLEWVPDHVIPHPGSRLAQSLLVELAPRARALVWDAFATGRIARDEAWSFDTFENVIEVRQGGTPSYLDRVRLRGDHRLDGIGGADGRGYVGTFGVFADTGDWESLSADLSAALLGIPGATGGASAIGTGGCVARVLAASAPALTEACSALWTAARGALLGRPALELRKP